MSMWSDKDYEGISDYPYYCAKCRVWHTDDSCSMIWCYKCKKDHKYEDACIFDPPQLQHHQEDSQASMADLWNMMGEMQARITRMTLVTKEPQEDAITHIEPLIEPLWSPSQEDSDEPHWLPAVQEMQRTLIARMEKEQESASQATVVEEELHEPGEECNIHEPVVDFATYEDSDSDSDWGGPVCPRWEDLPYCEPKPQAPSLPWHEWEETNIGSMWCADKEADEARVPIPIEVKAHTHTFEEFSVSHINQVCDELERLVYGDSLGEEYHEKFSISCHIGYFIDDPNVIVKELETNKCGGVDEWHGSIEEHLAHMRYYWDDFMAKDAFEPSGTWWKLMKRIKCKMKRVNFYTSPPSLQHMGALEVLEKRWWKKKKWRDKESSTILFN